MDKRFTALSVLIICLVAGVAGAFAYGQFRNEAAAAPPPPSPTQVREQNLDGSGFIRVHEQGTANVTGTVNVGNLPAVQDVNVVSQGQAGRLIELGTLPETPAGKVAFPPEDISDCNRISVFIAINGEGLQANLEFRASADGVTLARISLSGSESRESIDGQTRIVVHDSPAALPFFQVGLNQIGTDPGPLSDTTAWIWCVP